MGFEAERDSRLGVKMCLFMRKPVLLDSIKEHLGSFFRNSTKHVLQKRGNYGDKTARNLRLGVFFRRGEIAIRAPLGYFYTCYYTIGVPSKLLSLRGGSRKFTCCILNVCYLETFNILNRTPGTGH